MATSGYGSPVETFQKSYATVVDILLQQKASKLRSTVTEQPIPASESRAFLNQVGTVEVEKVVSRFPATPSASINRDRRWLIPENYHQAVPLDSFDQLSTEVSLDDGVALALSAAMGRKMDDVILSGTLGTNYIGETGTGTVAFTAGNIIADGGTAFTLDKLRTLITLMEDNDIEFGDEMNPVYGIISPQQKRDLLRSTKVTSSDYAAVKALVNGQVDTFLGITFMWHNRVPGASKSVQTSPGANLHRAIFYPKSGVAFGTRGDVQVRIDERADLSYTKQIYIKADMAACRTEEKKVYAIDSNITASVTE